LDHCTTGDGLVAALQLLAIVKREDKPVSQLCRRFEPVPQILKNVRLKAGRSLADTSVAAAIEDGREKLGKNGVSSSARLAPSRSSGDGEGDDRDLLERMSMTFARALASLKPLDGTIGKA